MQNTTYEKTSKQPGKFDVLYKQTSAMHKTNMMDQQCAEGDKTALQQKAVTPRCSTC